MKKALWYIILFSPGLILSCQEKVSQEQLIKSALALKVQQWRNEQMRTCKEKAITAAEAYVDSIMIVNALPTKLDTINKPPKPQKPMKPVFQQKPDTL